MIFKYRVILIKTVYKHISQQSGKYTGIISDDRFKI